MERYDAKDLIKSLATLGADGAELTTLVVKNYLRSMGFWATQDDVSDDMHALAQSGFLTKRDTGKYHVFKVASSAVYNSTSLGIVAVCMMHPAHLINAAIKTLDSGDYEACHALLTELKKRIVE